MSIANRALTDVALAWMKFVTTGELDASAVRPEIAESWRRCHKAGVNPYDGICHDVLEASELERLIEKHRELIEIARPFMTNLYKFFEGSGYIVMLTDSRGYIIEAFGDDSTLKNAIGLNFIKGANWTEESVGTNAIGTALVLKKPIQVSGPEHYCCKHHPWTCSAAPIFDHEGNMLGILDLSGPSDEAHPHTLGMVVAAVEAIREQMLLRQKNRELTLANSQLTSIIQTMSDGVIAFDKRGLVTQVNPAAEQIIGRRGRDLIGSSVKEVLGERACFIDQLLDEDEYDFFSDVEVMVDSLGGHIHCVISGKPILDDRGMITGGLILVRPIEKVQRLVNRFSGAQATFYFKDIIGESAGIKEAIRMAALAASSMSTVLLQGESGTGKELFAQAIHNHSPRRKGPFVAVNCGAIPRELIASELFGYEEGAFTGAKRGGRPGKFELASGGTLFLDEIGEMPLEQQVALLRVLQEKKIIRLGGDRFIPVDVRVICATNKNLLSEVEKGNFRRDLYYRVNVITINIPPLRERPEDIPLLFKYFLERICRDWGRDLPEVDTEVLEYLKRYHWPGNVRELQNVVERIVNIARGEKVTVECLPEELRRQSCPENSKVNQLACAMRIEDERRKRRKMDAEKERMVLLELLSKYGGNISRVARELGLSRNTIYRKMKRYQIT